MTDIETSYETGGQDRNYYICTTADPVDIPLLLLPSPHLFTSLTDKYHPDRDLANHQHKCSFSLIQRIMKLLTFWALMNCQNEPRILTLVSFFISLKFSEILLKFDVD